MAKIIRAHNYRWDVPLKEYKTDGTGFRDITRQTILGEGENEERLNFLTRYFEVQPGGYSSLEHHEHPHAVIIIRGEGEVILKDRVEQVGLHDCVYISPHTYHQFHATGKEPLGFLCMVDRERDRPQVPTDEEIEQLRRSSDVARKLKV